ncbi:MAG: glycosyltransferase [Patescibacteria group bacterium]|nr:glycosyltransferase [Patescibacteria group bacterium]
MKIALVHDYLAQDGGAERVLKAFHEIWPEAPIFVLFHDTKKIKYLPKENIRQSFISRLPLGKKCFQWYLPLMPLATEQHNLGDFDVVISSTSSFAKGVITHPNTLHISYCHTPPRYLWADANEYVSNLKRSGMVKFFIPRFLHKLRMWDRMSVDRVDHFIANSKTVRLRIQKYYRRDSDVVYPPVEMEKTGLAEKIENYFSAGGRLVPYKRFDLIVKAFNRLGLKLKIFGTGPERDNLKKIAKPNIEFLGYVDEKEKKEILGKSSAFIHPQLEDAGITALEAMACGRPVIAYGAGGAAETVLPGETGVLFPLQTWESLFDTVLNFNPENWDGTKIREHAAQFGIDNFKQTIKKIVGDRYEEFNKGLIQESLLR